MSEVDIVSHSQATSDGRVRCDACPVMCYVKPGMTGACDRYANQDGRIVFAIPYQGEFILIGTTDHDFRGNPGAVAPQPEEILYLCRAASECWGWVGRPG